MPKYSMGHGRSNALLGRRHGELNAEALKDAKHRVVSRLRARCECFVQTLAAEPRAFGDRPHAPRLRNMADRCKKDVRVRIFKSCRQVLSDDFVAVQELAGVKRLDLRHLGFLSNVSQQTLGPLDIASLSRLIASAEKEKHDPSSLREVNAVIRPEMHTKLADAGAHALGVAEVTLGHRLKPREDSRPRRCVLQLREPACEYVGLLDLEHATIVSDWIQTVNPARRLSCGLTIAFSGRPPRISVRHCIDHGPLDRELEGVPDRTPLPAAPISQNQVHRGVGTTGGSRTQFHQIAHPIHENQQCDTK